MNSYVRLIPLVMKPCLTLLKFISPLVSKKGINFLLRLPFKKDSDVHTDPDRSTFILVDYRSGSGPMWAKNTHKKCEVMYCYDMLDVLFRVLEFLEPIVKLKKKLSSRP